MITELSGKSYIYFKNIYDPSLFETNPIIAPIITHHTENNPDPNNLLSRLTLSQVVTPYSPQSPPVTLPQPTLLDQLITFNIKSHLYHPKHKLHQTDLIIWPDISNLSSEEIIDTIEKFQMTDSKYTLLPTNPTLKYNDKQINFQLKPYNFPLPETIIKHNYETFGLWNLDNIKL